MFASRRKLKASWSCFARRRAAHIVRSMSGPVVNGRSAIVTSLVTGDNYTVLPHVDSTSDRCVWYIYGTASGHLPPPPIHAPGVSIPHNFVVSHSLFSTHSNPFPTDLKRGRVVTQMCGPKVWVKTDTKLNTKLNYVYFTSPFRKRPYWFGLDLRLLLHGLVSRPNRLVAGYSSMQHASPLREFACHWITQCYLPPGRGDIPAFAPAEAVTQFSDPGGMQGWVTLQLGVRGI